MQNPGTACERSNFEAVFCTGGRNFQWHNNSYISDVSTPRLKIDIESNGEPADFLYIEQYKTIYTLRVPGLKLGFNLMGTPIALYI